MGRSKLTYDFVKEQFTKEDYVLLSEEYINCSSKLSYICTDGHAHSISWDNWKQGHRCPICAGQGKVNIIDIQESMKKEGYILITSKSLKDSKKYHYRCPKGHESFIRWGNWIQGRRCPKCKAIQHSTRTSGEGHYNWKGGITRFNKELRNYIKHIKWSDNVFKRDNYTCIKCNKRGGYLEAHHVVSLQSIKEKFSLKTIEEAEKCSVLSDISNGLTFCKSCHYKYHKKLKDKENYNE